MTVTETKLPPAIEFPSPPDPTGHVDYLDNGDVQIDNGFWISLAEYMIDVEATKKKYLAIREQYSKERKDGRIQNDD